MAGLLDITDDPQQLGLLSLGLRLMSAPGKFGQALGQSGLGAIGDMQSLKAQQMKNRVAMAQIADIEQQAELRKQQAAKMQRAQEMLGQVLGAPGTTGPAGSGISLGGVSSTNPSGATPGGLAAASPEAIAALKAEGIDISNLWELTRFGKEMQPGYRRNADGSVSYFGDPTKGIGFDPKTQTVSVLPGAASSQATLAGANTSATEGAKAPFEMVTVNMPDGSTRQMSKADFIAAKKAQAAGVPAPVANNAAVNGDATYQFNVGGKKGVFGGGDLGVSPGYEQQAQGAAIKTQEEEKAKQISAQRKAIVDAGFAAPKAIANMQRIGQLIGDLDAGKGTASMMNLASTLNTMGIKVDKKLPNKEAAQAALGEIALNLRNPSGGAGMPGAMSDADRNFLAGMTPGLEMTAEGRKQIINAQIAIHQRDQQVATFVRNYEKKYGRLDNPFFEQLQAWSNANPLFGGK